MLLMTLSEKNSGSDSQRDNRVSINVLFFSTSIMVAFVDAQIFLLTMCRLVSRLNTGWIYLMGMLIPKLYNRLVGLPNG